MAKRPTKKKAAVDAAGCTTAGCAESTPPPDKPLRLEWLKPEDLQENPANWRLHPESQVAGLHAVLGDPEIGWAGALVLNEQTGRLIAITAKEAWEVVGMSVPPLMMRAIARKVQEMLDGEAK